MNYESEPSCRRGHPFTAKKPFSFSVKELTLSHVSPFALITCVLLILSHLSGAISTAHAQIRAYVANTCNNNVAVIDVASNTVITSIPVPGPVGVAITPDGTKAYVTNQFDHAVSVIDTATNTVIQVVQVGINPFGLAITPDGARVYVVNGASNTVSVINTATNLVIANIPVGLGPRAVATTPDGTRAYVTNHTSNNVSVIDTLTNTVTAAIPVCCAPDEIAVTPDGTRAYVAVNGVSIIDLSTNVVIDNIPIGFVGSVSISPDGRRLYAGSLAGPGPHRVFVIDTEIDAVIATVTVGFGPRGIAVTPDSQRAYVTNQSSDNVFVIDTADNQVIATVPSAACPLGIAITPALAPTNKDECKDGGYRNFRPPVGPFKNQGQCVSFVERRSAAPH